MVRVPGNPGPQVSLNPLPDVQHQAFASPWSAAAEAAGKLNDVSEEADKLHVEEGLNQLRGKQIELYAEASSQLGGNVLPKNGKSFTDAYLEKFDGLVLKVGNGLSGQRQKTWFQERAQLMRTGFEGQVFTHEMRESKEYANSIDKNTIVMEIDNVVQHPGDVRDLVSAKARIENAVESIAHRNGWSPEETAVQRINALTKFHGAVVAEAIDNGRYSYATDYFNKHANEMNSEMQEKASKAIKDMSSDSLAVSMARTALETARANGLDKAKGYEIIDVQAGNDKGLRDKALTEYDHAFSMYRDQQKTLQEQDEASVYRLVLDRKSPSVVLHMISTLANTSETDKVKLRSDISKLYRGDAEDRAEAREARNETRAAELLKYKLNPDAVWKMNEDQLTNLLPRLGASGVNELVNMKREMQKRGPASFQVDADYFNKVANDVGMSPKNQSNTNKLLQVKAKIEAQIDEEQRANGAHPNRELSKERRDQITRYWFSDVIVNDGGFSGTSPKTRKRYEVSDARSIVAALPPDHVGAIVAYLEEQSRQAGRKDAITLADLTYEEIAQLDYQLFQGRK